MTVPEYEYTVEQCDVPEVRRKSMTEYRLFRRKCLEYMRGESNTLGIEPASLSHVLSKRAPWHDPPKGLGPPG